SFPSGLRPRGGYFGLRRDRRNFGRETLEELVDGLFYLSAGLIRHRDHVGHRRRAEGRRSWPACPPCSSFGGLPRHRRESRGEGPPNKTTCGSVVARSGSGARGG